MIEHEDLPHTASLNIHTGEKAAEFFRRRAEGAKTGDLRAVLARVPDREPDPGDELPERWQP